jgi:hypothetical protein
MLVHVRSYNRRFLQRGSAILGEIIHPSHQLKGGLFFWLNDRIARIKLANATITIRDSNIVIQQHPLFRNVLNTLEKTYSIALLYIRTN